MGSEEFDTLGKDGFEDVPFVVGVLRHLTLRTNKVFVPFYNAGTQAEPCNANK